MQTHIAQALLDPQAQGPRVAQARNGRFNVYRNNFEITLRNALRTTFPAIERLVGDEFFAALASAYAERNPPRSPIMAHYGDAFPGFLGQFAALADFPYLADVACLEYARVQAYHAADASGFDLDGEAAAMAALEQPARLHPSVRVVTSAFPALSIWEAQVEGGNDRQPDWQAEKALIFRQGAFDAVQAIAIDAPEQALLAHFATGGSLAALLADCPDQQAATLLITKFLELAAARILVPALPFQHGDNS